MAYDEDLARRVRVVLHRRQRISERKMFGGLCFLANGHMCCGVNGRDLMLRLGNSLASESLLKEHTRPMDFTGKALKSMIYVEPEGMESDEALREWIRIAVHFVRSLPPR